MGFLVSPMMRLFSKFTVLLLFVLWCASFTSTGWQSFSLCFFSVFQKLDSLSYWWGVVLSIFFFSQNGNCWGFGSLIRVVFWKVCFLNLMNEEMGWFHYIKHWRIMLFWCILGVFVNGFSLNSWAFSMSIHSFLLWVVANVKPSGIVVSSFKHD